MKVVSETDHPITSPNYYSQAIAHPQPGKRLEVYCLERTKQSLWTTGYGQVQCQGVTYWKRGDEVNIDRQDFETAVRMCRLVPRKVAGWTVEESAEI